MAMEDLLMHTGSTVKKGGEGTMVRNGSSFWVPERSWNLLKHKPVNTANGVVIGYTSGETGKTSQLLGKIGALILRLENGKQLKLSGLTHEQRAINDPAVHNEAIINPGSRLQEDYSHHLFPLGTVVEFKYRELSDDLVPKEARFERIRDED
jgi:ATP-dependent DNA ligase